MQQRAVLLSPRWQLDFRFCAPASVPSIGAKNEQECNMPLSISMIALSSQLVVAVADRVPTFDINRSCKLDAAAAAGLTIDQSMKSCVDDENKARQQLTSQWSSFPAASKANCIPQESIGDTPSYVSLLTCLQMGTWVR